MERTPCVVHTLQLVVDMMQREPTIQRLVDKVRHLVNQFRKSSVATECLLQRCYHPHQRLSHQMVQLLFYNVALSSTQRPHHSSSRIHGLGQPAAQWVAEDWYPERPSTAICWAHSVAGKWHPIPFPCCACSAGSQKSSVGVLSSSC